MVSSNIKIDRPLERYSIRFEIDPEGINLNRNLKEDSFELKPPPGAEIVRVEKQVG
jgi:hypothetical protein